MQLFTIGLDLLNPDGTPKLDADNQTISTYENEHIVSFARVWTGFTLDQKRANANFLGQNNIDQLVIDPSSRDRFPKQSLDEAGYLGDR